MEKNQNPALQKQKSAIAFLNEIIQFSKELSNTGQEAEFTAIQNIIKRVIEIQSEPIPYTICGNCIHWSKRSGNGTDNYGVCMASKNTRSKEMFSGCGLNTKQDFYCKIHTPKNKKENESPTLTA